MVTVRTHDLKGNLRSRFIGRPVVANLIAGGFHRAAVASRGVEAR